MICKTRAIKIRSTDQGCQKLKPNRRLELMIILWWWSIGIQCLLQNSHDYTKQRGNGMEERGEKKICSHLPCYLPYFGTTNSLCRLPKLLYSTRCFLRYFISLNIYTTSFHLQMHNLKIRAYVTSTERQEKKTFSSTTVPHFALWLFPSSLHSVTDILFVIVFSWWLGPAWACGGCMCQWPLILWVQF